MDSTERLNEITILTPCPMDWDRMSGDDQTHYCAECGKHVHDFAKMTSAQAIALIHELDGGVCGRLTRLADGTLVTADSTFAAEPAKTPWQFNIRSLMGIIAGFAAAFGIGKQLGEDTSTTPPPPRAPLLRPLMGRVMYVPRTQAPSPTSQNHLPDKPACPEER